jgi:glutaredoxin
MAIFKPIDEGYTIYSKSGCIYCNKVKQMLIEKNLFFVEVNCDDFLSEDKDKEFFLLFISEIAKKEYKTFPMIFYNGDFIGGYIETKENIETKEKKELWFDDI